MPQCSSFSPLRDRPQRCSLTLANQASTRSIFINQPSCVRPHQSPHPPQPRRSVRSIPSPQLRRLVGGAQIPIAPAAPSRFPQRAFLPWRFSDAGRWSLWHHLRAAGIRKPSQKQTFRLTFASSLRMNLSAHPGYARLPRHREPAGSAPSHRRLRCADPIPAAKGCQPSTAPYRRRRPGHAAPSPMRRGH